MGGTDAVAAATALGMMNAASGGMHNPMAGAAGGAQQTQPHLQTRQALSQMHPPQLAAAARAYRPAGAAGVGGPGWSALAAAAFYNPQLTGNGNGRGAVGAAGGSARPNLTAVEASREIGCDGPSSAADADARRPVRRTARGPPLRADRPAAASLARGPARPLPTLARNTRSSPSRTSRRRET